MSGRIWRSPRRAKWCTAGCTRDTRTTSTPASTAWTNRPFADPTSLSPAFHAPLPANIDKPAHQQWEGDDAAWDAIFLRHKIKPPLGGAFTRDLQRLAQAASPFGQTLALGWKRLTGSGVDGPLPQTFTTPEGAWSYAAISEAIDPARVAESSLLIDLQGLQGRIGVSLTDPTASTLLSKEHRIEPCGEAVTVRLPLPREAGPAHILLRNYDAEGTAGVVRIDRIAVG